MKTELLTVIEVAAWIKVTPRTIFKLRKEADFPATVKIGGKKLLWRAADIEAWVATR